MKYIKSIYIGLVGLLMTACQTEQWEASQGSLCITLAEDVSISTKSTPAELGKPTAERFTLNIVKESTGENTYNGIYKQTIPASTGAYTVTATYGTNLAIALDSPYYKGEETGVEVEVNQSTPVTLTCKVANALASVIYGEGQIDKFDELFSTYGVEVKVGNSSVTIGRNGSTTQSAYYRAGSTPTFTFKGTLKENSQNVSMEITSDELTTDAFQAGQHCKFTLSLEPATAGAIITVEKVEVETVTISETIPVEWLPKPKIEAEGFEANKLTFAETEAKSASIKLITATALQDLKLKFNFEDEQFQSSLQKDKEYVLSNVEDKQAIETALDITLPAIGTTEEVTLDLSPLLAKLQTNAGVTTNNSIEIDAKANNRWSSEKEENNVSRVFTLECNKPEFTVSAYPGNIWTKEFVSCWVLANFAWHKDPSLSFSLNFDFTNPYNSIYVSAECELELEDYTLMLGNKFAEILYPSALDFYSGGSKDEPTLNFDLKFHVGSFLEVDGRRYDISFDLLINFSARAEVFADDYDLHNLPHEVKLEIII